MHYEYLKYHIEDICIVCFYHIYTLIWCNKLDTSGLVISGEQ